MHRHYYTHRLARDAAVGADVAVADGPREGEAGGLDRLPVGVDVPKNYIYIYTYIYIHIYIYIEKGSSWLTTGEERSWICDRSLQQRR
jgi:hypothetical protein